MKTHRQTGNNGGVSTATASQTAPAHPVVNRPNVTTVGFIVFLASDLMFFAALFAMYFTIRSVVPELWETRTQTLDIPYALGNTLILVSSSFTCQIGVFAAERFRPRRTGSLFNIAQSGLLQWFYSPFILGAIFVSGHVMEYATSVSEGTAINPDVYGSVFYLPTGCPASHVTIGLICLRLVIGRDYTAKNFGHHEA